MVKSSKTVGIAELERCIDEKLSFNDIATVTVCLYADLKYCPKAEKVLEKAKKKCPTELSKSDIEREVGWDGLYNQRMREILAEYGYKTWVDKWGAYCWTDSLGNHCGDSSGFFPFYLHEEVLRKDLDRGKIPEPLIV